MDISAVDTVTAIRDNKPVEQVVVEKELKEALRQPPPKEDNKGVYIDQMV